MDLLEKLKINHRPRSGALDLLKYIGPGLLVTVGFIDPGNWATNILILLASLVTILNIVLLISLF